MVSMFRISCVCHLASCHRPRSRRLISGASCSVRIHLKSDHRMMNARSVQSLMECLYQRPCQTSCPRCGFGTMRLSGSKLASSLSRKVRRLARAGVVVVALELDVVAGELLADPEIVQTPAEMTLSAFLEWFPSTVEPETVALINHVEGDGSFSGDIL